jgi:hypothetical protein
LKRPSILEQTNEDTLFLTMSHHHLGTAADLSRHESGKPVHHHFNLIDSLSSIHQHKDSSSQQVSPFKSICCNHSLMSCAD